MQSALLVLRCAAFFLSSDLCNSDISVQLTEIGKNGYVAYKKKVYCLRCGFNTSRQALASITRHIEGRHFKRRRFKCSKCSLKALARYNVRNHISKLHKSADAYIVRIDEREALDKLFSIDETAARLLTLIKQTV